LQKLKHRRVPSSSPDIIQGPATVLTGSQSESPDPTLLEHLAASMGSTDFDEPLPNLLKRATSKVNDFIECGNRYDQYLKPTLHSFLVWLPQIGQVKLCNDIINSKSNEDLSKICDDMVTGLIFPSKFN
jgi:hypothetical protein